MPKYNYGSEPLNDGDRVKIIGLTDIDEPGQQCPDDFGWIGQYGIVVQAVMNDYYDCLVKLELGTTDEAVIRAYGNPPTIAMKYDDLEKVGGCKHCIAPDAFSHTTEEHSENWVNLADARYTGEVIFMPAHIIFDALETLDIPDTLNEKVKTHVDRRIVQALLDTIITEDAGDDTSIRDALQKLLEDNPERPEL